MTGRPSSYRADLAESVLEHLSAGGSLRTWCARAGRPTRYSVLRWVLSDIDGFAAAYRQARRLGCEALADDLRNEAYKAVGKDMPGVTAQRLIVDTIKWELSKRAPEQFGDAVHHSHVLAGASIHVYLPQKGGSTAPVIDGTSELLEDGDDNT
jgi:hypothetical protein